MAQVVWTEPALQDLDAIADYIALDKPEAARALVKRIFSHADHLATHPQMGSVPLELRGKRYRQIVEPPCRVFYRHEASEDICLIVHVMRSEQRLRKTALQRKRR